MWAETDVLLKCIKTFSDKPQKTPKFNHGDIM